jgi:hypothetical protein
MTSQRPTCASDADGARKCKLAKSILFKLQVAFKYYVKLQPSDRFLNILWFLISNKLLPKSQYFKAKIFKTGLKVGFCLTKLYCYFYPFCYHTLIYYLFTVTCYMTYFGILFILKVKTKNDQDQEF